MNKSFSVLCAVVLAGCQTAPVTLYEGPERPIGQLAVVRTWNQYVLVEKIDGKPSQDGRVSHAYVVPGEHVLTVKFLGGAGPRFAFSRPADLPPVRMEAGHSYTVVAMPDYQNEKVQFRVVDKGRNYDPECLIPRPFEANVTRGKNC
jgi:hypothetical protein